MLPKYLRALSIFSFIFVLIILFNNKILADNFSNASILLLRNAPSTPTTILVCATTPADDNGIETNVRITFPNSFTVSTDITDWSVNTSNLPSDASPWPGIETANNVSSKTVTFPSLNLNSNTTYCFRTSDSSSLSTAGSSGSHKGNLSTYQGGSIIDSSSFGLNVGSDQIEINAVVPANATDFQAEMALTSSASPTFPQNTTLTYTLNYGSYLTSNSNITVEAEWSMGTVSGSGSPTVEVLDYVIGSASNGYNNTPPVVDLVNRKITWTINSFPSSTTDETITFQLKTNDNYKGGELVSFDVSGRVIGPGTQTPDSTVTRNYKHNFGVLPTPTPTKKPSSSKPSSTGSVTPTITPTLPPETTTPLRIDQIEVRGISPTTADVFVRLNKISNIVIEYGSNINNLTQRIESNELTNEYLILLRDLAPDTDYFYRIIASDQNLTVNSEIFIFRTASDISPVKIENESFMVIGNNLLIYDQSLVNQRKIAPVVIVPTSFSYTFSLAFDNSSEIKTIQAFLRKKFILSGESESSENLQNISLIETRNGEFTGQLDSTIDRGEYELHIRISDRLGNIFEEKAADFRIVDPFTVLSQNGSPIEGAEINLFLFNPTTRIYEEINESNLPIKNPEKTLPDGTAEIILPQGRYKAEISAILYKDKSVEFVLGEGTEDNYPIVYLDPAPFNLITLSQYFFETGVNYFSFASQFVERLNSSNRLFELMAFVTVSLFTLIAFFSLLFRTRNTVKSMYHFLMHAAKSHSLSSELPSKGIVKDSSNKPISGALVSFLKNHEVVFQTTTNSNGIFFTNKKELDHIEVSKVGYENKLFPFNHQLDENNPTFHIEKPDKLVQSILHTTMEMAKYAVGLLFELIIIALVFLEIIFIPTFGLLRILPFLILTALMLFIYIHQSILRNKYF